MSAGLKDYDAKRDFDRTPEPPGDASASESGRLYVIHKHAASRLHYDLRLEHDGVLLSWAVPKGPSFDTRQRRLAVHVEDHPVDYGDFEGVIPAGEYGGGTVMLWDTGTWHPHGDVADSLAAGKLVFDLHGEKLQGRFGLIHTGARKSGREQNQWLLIKEKDSFVRPSDEFDVVAERPDSAATGRTMDEIAAGGVVPDDPGDDESPDASLESRLSDLPEARRSPLPERLEPQLASPVDRAPEGDDWIHEIKHDGYRIMIRVQDGTSQVFTREGVDWTKRFPAVADAATRLPVREAFLDAEAVFLGPEGLSDFGALQSALDHGSPDGVSAFAFDLLHLDGFDLHEVPLQTRRGLLDLVLGTGEQSTLKYSEGVDGDHATILEAACGLGAEGIVSKRRHAPYRPGRSTDWLKAKCVHRQEFVVVGTRATRGGGGGLGALLLGYFDGPRLVYAGRVGSGISEAAGRRLSSALSELARDTSPLSIVPDDVQDVTWSEPRTVVEVSFAGWTRGDRLRHPVFVAVREDRDPSTVVRESTSQLIPDPAEDAGPTVVEGVEITNADKVMIDAGPDKGSLARYYSDVAPHLLQHLADRPLTLLRCPNGAKGPCFWQRHLGEGIVAGVESFASNEREYMTLSDPSALVGLVQYLAVEFHVWGSKVADPDRPDRLVFDLDPGPGVDWDDVRAAALLMREILDGHGLMSFVRTTGGKGLHVVAPIEPRVPVVDAAAVTKSLALEAVGSSGGMLTTDPRKSARQGAIFLDWHRNSRGQSAIASYSVRARTGSFVATPLSWDELHAGVDPTAFSPQAVLERLATIGDPWRDIGAVEQHLPQEALDL